jgi:hypothetical protein
MRGSHLGMRIPWMGGRCQRGVRTPSCERRPGDDARFASGDARFASGDANSAGVAALSTWSSHALVRTAARGDARFASGDANSADVGALSTRSSHALVRTAARGDARFASGDARFASGDANSADGGALSTRSSHALVRTAARRRCAVRIWGCAVRIWGCELRGCGGVVNAEFARPRANGGQETMRGSHLGMRTPRMGGRCQRGVRTPSCERRPGDDARFASGDANSAGVGALSTRSSHAHGRTVARRRCAVRIWGCELRGWGGVVNAEFARPRANGGQETMRGSHLESVAEFNLWLTNGDR